MHIPLRRRFYFELHRLKVMVRATRLDNRVEGNRYSNARNQSWPISVPVIGGWSNSCIFHSAVDLILNYTGQVAIMQKLLDYGVLYVMTWAFRSQVRQG